MIKRINTDKLQRFCELNKLGIKDQEYFKLREELMVLYMPMAERIVLNLGITSIDKEDLTQLAYEALILLLDELIDYKKFSPYLHRKIEVNVKAFKNDYEPVASPISEVEIQSNLDVEEYVVDKLYTKQLYKKIHEKLETYNKGKSQRNIELFKKYYGLIGEPMTIRELSKTFNINHARPHQIINDVRRRTIWKLLRTGISIYNVYDEYNVPGEYNDIEHNHHYTKIKK